MEEDFKTYRGRGDWPQRSPVQRPQQYLSQKKSNDILGLFQILFVQKMDRYGKSRLGGTLTGGGPTPI